MRRYNFDFQEAMNGLQAVETYKRAGGQFDYVLMDLTMPVMDGMAATREIRRHEQREGLPPTVVIALTGLASAAARVDALSSGINFFLTKPVKFQALHQMLKGAAAGGAMGPLQPPSSLSPPPPSSPPSAPPPPAQPQKRASDQGIGD
ncbi:Hybrid signal transduction histidine kinase M [Lasiodiplodia hormozganensis]|uniref:Hybrid signal transduction histidine kinase M n=1 Tax=Lasiodiplodia hormozganensis TaxID=869390 RepID=A0AA39XYX7_9PEZI|nr:Hybrid signal transduction histidine kinase M [Lasiodiplodia hormozganensis]